jgi:hypothetical protein
MKKLLLILILTFTFQALTKADDIRDLEIEGMSIGDSLLDYFSQDEIKNSNTYKYKNDKFIGVDLRLKNTEVYELVQIHYKSSNEYIIASTIGAIFYEDINKCYKKKDEIVKDLSKSLENYKIINDGTFQASEDKTGKSTMTAVVFELENGEIGVTCSYFSNEFKIKNNYQNNIRVDISTKEFSDWLRNEAY